MSELKEFGAYLFTFRRERPWFSGIEWVVGRVESEEGGETTELDPTSHQVVVLDISTGDIDSTPIKSRTLIPNMCPPMS